MEFTLEFEQNNFINFLDITIKKYVTNLDFQLKISIYRKPTTTDCIIPYSPCHSDDQKMVAVRYFEGRKNTYDLHPHDKDRETQILKYHSI
jgi:hypothetical protein